MRRPTAYLLAVATALGAGLALAGPGSAASGGGGLQGGSPAPATAPAGGAVSSSAGGMTLSVTESVFLRHQMVFHGNAADARSGATVEVERYGARTGYRWTPTGQAHVRSDGTFTVTWQANHIGRYAFRAILSRAAGGSAASSAWPTVTATIYRPSVATWYGPGSWGSTTACGEVLRSNMLGVANRTLPCGTRVAIYYHGRSMVVPVIDRGPYGNADWDLTLATARALGTEQAGVATIGAVSLPRGS